MASTYSSDLQLELIATGEKAGLWGTITNNNLQILELSASGYYTVSIASGDLTLNLDNGSALGASTATGKNLMIEVTGTLAGNRVITMPTGAETRFATDQLTQYFVSNDLNVGGDEELWNKYISEFAQARKTNPNLTVDSWWKNTYGAN